MPQPEAQEPCLTHILSLRAGAESLVLLCVTDQPYSAFMLLCVTDQPYSAFMLLCVTDQPYSAFMHIQFRLRLNH